MLRRALLRNFNLTRSAVNDSIPVAAIQLQQVANSTANDHSSSNGWAWGVLAAALIGSAGTAHSASIDGEAPQQQSTWSLISLEQRRKAFFKYEKRVRELSPPEKVFEYFASQGSLQKGFFMTPGDMMRSVVPVYPPAGSDVLRAGSLPGEPGPNMPSNGIGYTSSFLKVFDVDGSGGVTFDEWLVFQSLLSIPDADVQVAFMMVDTDSSGKIDKDEFMQLLKSIQGRAAKPTPTLRGSSVGDLTKAKCGLVTLFFGKDGRGQITLQDFQKFISDLRNELVRLEFDFYDYEKNGKITGVDFAHSIAGSARLKHTDTYLDKIENMPEELRNAELTFQEFAHFRTIWRRLRQLATALEFWKSAYGTVMPADFSVISNRVLGVALPKLQLDILYYLFGNEDGSLNVTFMFGVMDRHFETGLTVNYEHLGGGGENGFFSCMQKCAAKNH